MKMVYILSVCIFLLSPLTHVTAQSALNEPKTDRNENSGGSVKAARGFRGIELGMGIDQVKDMLTSDPYFYYRGDPDVYILPAKEQTLIECGGNIYIERAYFQFFEKKLFIIMIEINENTVDYYSMYTTLSGKYGESSSFTPTHVTWEQAGVTVSLERPLTVKYIDSAVFTRIKEAGKATETFEEKTLKDFLGEF